MRVKKYIVDTMPEAMKKIRDELGNDAIILNQKEIKVSGFFGLFGKKKIEVIAAVDPNVQTQRPRSQAQTPSPISSQASAQTSQTRPVVQSTPSNLNLNVASANQAYGGQVSAGKARDAEPPATIPTSPAATAAKAAPPAGSSTPASTATTAPVVKEAVPAEDNSVPVSTLNKDEQKKQEDSILTEIKQMKEMMLKLSTANREQQPNPMSIQMMIDHLEGQEFDSHLIEEMIFFVKNEFETHQITEPTDQQVKELIRTQLEKIVYSNGVETIAPDTRIAHFVGPTGVGKTTTIAKLAADQVLNHKRKVGFITADTYRIAAVEQLRTYASILNAPIEVAMSPQDLIRAYESMKDLDIIFMDTAGRNFRNEMYVSELNTMLNSSSQSETYLVLSMTMKYSDMKAVTENFSRIRIDRLLFSKMDETASFGSIVNLIHQFAIPLSYFTHGQQVPNDIEVVREDRFIDRLMGEDMNE